LQLVDAETAHDGNQESPRGPNLVICCLKPAQKGFLHHVFGVCYRPEHSVRNREEQPSVLIERREAGSVVREFFGAVGEFSVAQKRLLRFAE
jgi:hypothetical protein